MNEKIDFHLNLNAGMEYKYFEKWAGFYIPEAEPKDIADLTFTRIENEKDVVSLFELSLENALNLGLEKVVCNVEIPVMKGLETPRDLVSIIQSLKHKYSEKHLDVKSYLMLDSDISQSFEPQAVASTFSLLGSGEFIGLCLKGLDFLKKPKKFDHYVYSVQKHGQKIKIDFSTFDNTKEIDNQLLQRVIPNEVAGTSLFDLDFFITNKEFLAENKIAVIFTPDNFSKFENEFMSRLKLLSDFGIEIKLGSGNYLFNKIPFTEFLKKIYF